MSGVCCTDGKCKAEANGCCSNSDCSSGEVCNQSTKTCTTQCLGGLTYCNGVCVDLTSNTSNCGGCGNVCGGNSTTCKGGCVVGSMSAYYCGDRNVSSIIGDVSGSCQESCLGGTCYCNAVLSCPADRTVISCCGKNSTCPSDYCGSNGQKCTYSLSQSCYVGCSNIPPPHCTSCTPTCTASCSSCQTGQTCDTASGQCVSSGVTPTCGNEICESGESSSNCCKDCGCSTGSCCNNACVTPACTNLDDGNPCTSDTCNIADPCNPQQVHTPLSGVSCPGGTCQNGACIAAQTGCSSDSNCPGQKCCSGACVTSACTTNSQCNDGNSCTSDVCQNPNSCNAACAHTPMSSCCGNGRCDAGEGCATCPGDCPCIGGSTCINNICNAKQLLQSGDRCTNSNDCSSGYCNNGYCCAAGTCCRSDSECSGGKACISNTCQNSGAKCADGTSAGQCSKSKPHFCNNGNDVFACPTCGCDEGSICTMSGICNKLECSDGTPFGACSSNKPLFCNDGALINNCSKCGCDEGYLCEAKSAVCYQKPTITIISPSENSTVNVAEDKKVVIRGLVSKGGWENAIELNSSEFILSSYNNLTGEFSFENISPVTMGLNSVAVHLIDRKGDILASEIRDFNVIDVPQGNNLYSLQDILWILVQIALLIFFLAVLLNFILPLVRGIGTGAVDFPPGAIVLVEGRVGSGKEEFCLSMIRRVIGNNNFASVLSHDPMKEENWFRENEKNRLVFMKIEPDINEISWGISKALDAKPKVIFFNIMDLLMPKYNPEELTDFLNTNFKKLRDAGCGAVFCVDRGADEKNLSAIEGLFDGVVEFEVKDEKGKLKSSYRVKEFRLGKMDTNWRRFK
ncbi:hypothetical protein H0N99_01525 [Candidatus Micrarchaeota archaeon]|nr:hypothetical protein [Candidatus Micrarchaeota archaeon]